MRLGVPRGLFYYDYIEFIKLLFDSTEIKLVWGEENNDDTLLAGSRFVVDEACFPIKLFAGQVASLLEKCDAVLIPRLMKDFSGRWLCPKLLGLPEILWELPDHNKLFITEPLYFDDSKKLKKSLWELCGKTGMNRKKFNMNFSKAYMYQKNLMSGAVHQHIEAAWEFTPLPPAEGEIILPNTFSILLAGHCYNVYDNYANGEIMKKLDALGIETVTERCAGHREREKAVADLNLIKTPFWESMVRILGSAMHLKNQIDGIIYLSSFSCGPDAFIIELLKEHIKEIPVMILKLDEHKGEAGYETRLEAFADLLKYRRMV